jgi:hypothetical protein
MAWATSWHQGANNSFVDGTQVLAGSDDFEFAYGVTTVPPIPPNPDDHGVTYWIAIESHNNVDWILQPSLNYGNNWDCGCTSGKWFIHAYELDNNNSSHCGSVVTVDPGDQIVFEIYLQSRSFEPYFGFWIDTWYLAAYDTTKNLSSTLTYSTLEEKNDLVAAQEWVNVSGSGGCGETPSNTISEIEAASMGSNGNAIQISMGTEAQGNDFIPGCNQSASFSNWDGLADYGQVSFHF